MIHSVHMIIFHGTETWSNLSLGPPTLLFTYFFLELNFFNIQFYFAHLAYNIYVKITDNISALFVLKEIKLIFVFSTLFVHKATGSREWVVCQGAMPTHHDHCFKTSQKRGSPWCFLGLKPIAVVFPDSIMHHVFKAQSMFGEHTMIDSTINFPESFEDKLTRKIIMILILNIWAPQPQQKQPYHLWSTYYMPSVSLHTVHILPPIFKII